MTILLQVQNDLERAKALDDPNHNVCYFALADRNGLPSVRTLVLRSISDSSLTLFSNKTSPKWEILTANPCCQILLWYPSIQIQYRLSGSCSALAQDSLENDWQRRPDKSKLLDYFYQSGHPQSGPIESRTVLTHGLKTLGKKMPVEELKMPASAGAFTVEIQQVDYLRLTQNEEPHFRERHTKKQTNWSTETLVP